MTGGVARMVAVGAVLLSLVATGSAEPTAWPLVAIAGFVAIVLTWTAFTNGSVAAPVVTLLAVAVLFSFVESSIAVGPLAGCVFALVAGEAIWAVQALGDQGAAVVRPVDPTRSMATTGLTASGVIIVVMAVSRLPDRRIWSIAALVALVGLAALTQRRRSTLEVVPLPPPRGPV